MAINPCPNCGEEIARDKLSIAEGVGLCDACGKLSRLAEIADAGDESDDMGRESRFPDANIDIDRPPAGCAIEDRGHEIIVRASARSFSTAIGAGLFATFWNGIVSVFVLIVVASLYNNLAGKPLPSWFPAPTGGGSGNLGPNMPLGMALFLCVFLTPFVLVGSVMIGVVLVSLFGCNKVRISGDTGKVITAVGPFGWSRRFDASKVSRVSLGRTTWQENGRSKPAIRIEADRTIRFGSSLREDRRRWMHAALHHVLVLPARQPSRVLGKRS